MMYQVKKKINNIIPCCLAIRRNFVITWSNLISVINFCLIFKEIAIFI